MDKIEVKRQVRGPWVEVDLGILANNIRRVRKAAAPGAEIIFVVKANAYGHGLVPVAQSAARAGVDWLAVAYDTEALAIRAELPDVRLLVLGAVDPAQAPLLLRERIVPAVVSLEHGRALGAAAAAAGGVLPVHLKVDTGMSRLGAPWPEAEAVLAELFRTEGLEVQGLCSHFATVEPDRPVAAQAQYERFARVAESAPRPLFKHLSSSRAFLYHPEWDFDAVRIGIALYGYGTDDPAARVHCRPCLQWKTTVTQVKKVPAGSAVGYYGTHVTDTPTWLATIALGYADGYLRTLSNRADVLIRGRRYPVVGRVSMNWISVDLGPETDVVPGDEVVLLGEQHGESVWANELASKCRTIAYEILVGINSAIERKYVG